MNVYSKQIFRAGLQLQPTVSIMEPLVEENCSYTQV